MRTDITQGRSAEQRVAQGMQRHVAVGMRGQAAVVGYAHTAQHHVVAVAVGGPDHSWPKVSNTGGWDGIERIADFLALTGDSVDNIPGVPKCGPKTAAKWLKQYKTLDELMAHADEIKGKVGEYLRQSLPQLPLSRELVTIRLDLDLELAPDGLRPSAPDHAALRELLAGLARGDALIAAWDAYEAQADPEARFVRQLDRLDPGDRQARRLWADVLRARLASGDRV